MEREQERSKADSTEEEEKQHIDEQVERIDSNTPDDFYDIDPLAEKRLVRKIDMRIMPACMTIYTLSFLDRSNIGNAKILNANTGDSLMQTTHISNGQYLDALVVFFIAYALFEIPSNYALKRYFPSRWLAFIMFGWGATTMGQAAVNDFAALTGVRFLLGAFEAGLFSGIIYYLTFWYRPNERAVRIALIAACATLGGAFGGSIAYGIGFLNERHGIQGWRWLCIIEGGTTCLLSFLVPPILPDYPETSHFLSPSERRLATARVANDSPQGLARISWTETRATLVDWRLYLHYLAFLCVSPPFSGFSLFTPTLVEGLGFTGLAAQLFTVPPFGAAFIFAVAVSYIADRTERWSLAALLCTTFSGIFFIVQGAIPAHLFVARYVALCLCTCFSFAANPLLMNYLTSNIRGTSAMTLGVPLNVTLATSGQIIGLFLYKPSQAPAYLTGHFTNAGFMLLAALLVFALRIIYARRNRRLAPGEKRWRV